jgi:hypothetical protein
VPIINSFTAYVIEIEWLLTWFPIQDNAAIDAQRTRSGRVVYRSADEPFASGNGSSLLLGQGPQAPFTFGDPISTNNVAHGSITLGLNQDELFVVTIEARLGQASQIRTLLAPPKTLFPFMINVVPRANQREVHGTALSLHGTITTGKRPAAQYQHTHVTTERSAIGHEGRKDRCRRTPPFRLRSEVATEQPGRPAALDAHRSPRPRALAAMQLAPPVRRPSAFRNSLRRRSTTSDFIGRIDTPTGS